MNDSRQGPPAAPERLDSWKEIAAYLNKDVRTVQRWEGQAGLPVRRKRVGHKAVVYAYPSEVDAWLASSGGRERGVTAASIRLARPAMLTLAVLSAVGLYVAVGSKAPTLGEKDLPVGTVLQQIQIPGRGPVGDFGATISPDGEKIAYSPDFGVFVIDRIKDGRREQSFSFLTVYRTVWSPDSSIIAVAADAVDGQIETRLISVHTGESYLRVYRRDADIVPRDWDPAGKRLLCVLREPDRSFLGWVGEDSAFQSVAEIEGGQFRLSPDARFVAFAQGGSSPEIHVLALDRPKDGTTVIAPHPGSDINPVWSPDGNFLVFLSNRTRTWDLWGVPINEGKASGEPILLHKEIGEEVFLSQWLPNGWLTLGKNDAIQDIWLTPFDLETLTVGKPELIPQPVRGRSGQPRWSPDGTRRAYRSRRHGHDSAELYVLDVESREEQKAILPAGSFLNTVWTPNHKLLTWFMLHDPAQPNCFLEYDPATRESNVFLRHELVAGGGYTPKPDMARDGRFLFDAWGDRSQAGLYIFEKEGIPRKVPETEDGCCGRWSPDGAWIAFLERPDFRSFSLIRPDGLMRRRLFELEPGANSTPFFTWTPDGSHILYPRFKGPRSSLWVFSYATGENRELWQDDNINPWWIDLSPDGKKLAISGSSGKEEFWVMENFVPRTLQARLSAF